MKVPDPVTEAAADETQASTDADIAIPFNPLWTKIRRTEVAGSL